MKSDSRNNKTIDFNETKKQLSSKNNVRPYFNPYARQTEENQTIVYDNTNYNNDRNPYNTNQTHTHTPKISTQQRKEQLKVHHKPSKKEIRKNKRKRSIGFIVKLIIVMVITIALVWGAISIKDMLTYPKVSYQIVQTGSIDTSQTLEGIIIRTEKVYYSENEGMLQTIIAEGEKVKRNGAVCVLMNNTELQQTQQEKNKMSTEIYNSADTRKQFSYYIDDIYQINVNIKNTMNTFYTERLKDTTEYIYAVRNELDNAMDKRTELYVKEQSELNNLTAQRLTLLDHKINSLKFASITEEAGIISYRTDGEESEITPQIIDSMQYDTYQELRQKSYQNTSSNTYIEKGAPLYKIIYDHTWYIATYTDIKEAEMYKEGENYKLFFDNVDQIQLNFKLQTKITEDNKVKLVFVTNERIDQFLNLRTVDFSIGNKNEEGIKIPIQAIVEQNMIKIPSEYKVEKDRAIGVYRKNGEINEFVTVNPQYEREDIIYILQEIGNREHIQLGDILIHPINNNTHKIERLQTIEGVYVINGKLAKYKAIDIYLQNKEYAIVKYSPSNELKELDKIISNPKSIKRDQLLQHMNIQNE